MTYHLFCLPVFASLSRWRATLASLVRIEDKDQNVHDAISRCRREIGRIMARAINAAEAPFDPSALPVGPGPERRTLPDARPPALPDLQPLDFAGRAFRVKIE